MFQGIVLPATPGRPPACATISPHPGRLPLVGFMQIAPQYPALWFGQGPPPDPESAADGAAQRPRQPATVLVVDDERVIADTVAEILTMMGYSAIPVYSGSAALESCAGTCPDLIISDVVMPGLDGIETAKQLLKRCPTARILLLSGQASTAAMIQQAKAEGYDFHLLAKPLHPDDLLDTLRRFGF